MNIYVDAVLENVDVVLEKQCPLSAHDLWSLPHSFILPRYTLAEIHQCLLKLHQQHVAAEDFPQQAMR